MYTNDYPTQELTYPRQRDHRRWLVAGGGLAVLIVLLLAVAVGCRGAGTESLPAAAGAGGRATTVIPADSAASDPADGGSTAGDAEPAGDPGNGGEPGDDGPPPTPGGGDDSEPVEPEPLQLNVSVFGPPPTPGCRATGTIVVTGGEYPMEVTYVWLRMHQLGGGQQPVPVPYGPPETVTFDEPGDLEVVSADFPAPAGQNRMQLRVVAPEPAASGFVTYPKCAELGISG